MRLFATRPRFLWSIPVCAALVVACVTREFSDSPVLSAIDPSEVHGLDVNDVSILFPMPLSEKQSAGLLKFSDSNNSRKKILEPQIFEQIIASSRSRFSMIPGADVYDNWKIVGMRWNPCAESTNLNNFNFISDFKNCKFEIRLIAQPLLKNLTYANYAIQLNFDLPNINQELTLKNLVTDLFKLKLNSPEDTNHRPLGIHPGLQKSQLNSIYSANFKEMILKYVSQSTLNTVAFMGSEKNSFPVSFLKFNISSEKAEFINISDLETKNLSIHTKKKEPNSNLILQAADPRRQSQHNTNCETCHTSTLSQNQWLDYSKRPDFFVPDTGISGHATAGSIPKTAESSFRSFGFEGNEAIVSLRTINESSVLAAAVNRVILQKLNPSPQAPVNLRSNNNLEFKVDFSAFVSGKDSQNHKKIQAKFEKLRLREGETVTIASGTMPFPSRDNWNAQLHVHSANQNTARVQLYLVKTNATHETFLTLPVMAAPIGTQSIFANNNTDQIAEIKNLRLALIPSWTVHPKID